MALGLLDGQRGDQVPGDLADLVERFIEVLSSLGGRGTLRRLINKLAAAACKWLRRPSGGSQDSCGTGWRWCASS
ncbi:MAG: hypothetical protein R2705_13815 [Ilumatobacteraceae bacterium]